MTRTFVFYIMLTGVAVVDSRHLLHQWNMTLEQLMYHPKMGRLQLKTGVGQLQNMCSVFLGQSVV